MSAKRSAVSFPYDMVIFYVCLFDIVSSSNPLILNGCIVKKKTCNPNVKKVLPFFRKGRGQMPERFYLLVGVSVCRYDEDMYPVCLYLSVMVAVCEVDYYACLV